MGWPKNGIRFFLGRRFDPPRAGMIATGFTVLAKGHPLFPLRRGSRGEGNAERESCVIERKARASATSHAFHKVSQFGNVSLVNLEIEFDDFLIFPGLNDVNGILEQVPLQFALRSDERTVARIRALNEIQMY